MLRPVTSMSLVGRNIIANLSGSVIVTILTLAITPAQINILGLEAYGIVGFITTLQLAFTTLDLGLSSTLTRELAADTSKFKRASGPLLRTALTVYWSVAFAMGILITLCAGMVANRWFNASELSDETLESSLQIIAFYLALRWPVALYSGVLSGLQRMDVLNLNKAVSAIVRLAGGLVVLVLWRSLEAFLLWTAFAALLELALYIVTCHVVHPLMPIQLGLSREAIKKVWRFSLSMTFLSFLAVLIVQFDRIVVSSQLSLTELGTYNLAYTTASGLALIIGAISAAILPAFSAAQSRTDTANLTLQYMKLDRVILFVITPVSMVLILYGQLILNLWVGETSANGAALPLALLTIGFWLSSTIVNIYNVAVAYGMPARHLRANLVLALPYLMLLNFLVTNYGVSGAASAWIVLNLAYVIILARPIHRQLLHVKTLNWLMNPVLKCCGLALFSFGPPYLILMAMPFEPAPLASIAALAVSGLLWIVTSYAAGLSRDIASIILLIFKSRIARK